MTTAPQPRQSTHPPAGNHNHLWADRNRAAYAAVNIDWEYCDRSAQNPFLTEQAVNCPEEQRVQAADWGRSGLGLRARVAEFYTSGKSRYHWHLAPS